jgi:SLOG in TRPM, prokaryote
MSPSNGEVRHYEPYTITFASGDTARAVRVPQHGDPESILHALALKTSPVLFIIGGAGLMDDDSMSITRSVVENGIARFAEEHQLVVMDGGTAAGVMALIGMARKRGAYNFPLVGVAPASRVEYPGQVGDEEDSRLDSFHSHFVLTDGDEFGDESDMIAMLVTALSLDRRLPALGIVINGGQIAQHEVYMRSASGEMTFPLLVIEGSGRLADELGEAKKTGVMSAEDAEPFADILAGDVQFIHINDGSDALRAKLEEYFPTAV